MARARVNISLNTHELAIIAEALRVYSEVLRADLTGVQTEVRFNDALFNNNWSLGYMRIEELRAQIGDGEPEAPQVAPAATAPQVAPRKKKGPSTMGQVRKARGWGRKVSRLLG